MGSPAQQAPGPQPHHGRCMCQGRLPRTSRGGGDSSEGSARSPREERPDSPSPAHAWGRDVRALPRHRAPAGLTRTM